MDESIDRTSENEASSLDLVELDSPEEDFLFYDSGNEDIELALAVQDDGDLESPLRDDEEEKDDIDSEEEKDILKGIRYDIEGKVREEMKDELQVYETRLRAIENGELPAITDDDKTEIKDDSAQGQMDPKLKEAFIKMKKLDRILKKKVKRERQVKRERLLLERRLRDELAQMDTASSNFREIKMNTERFLSLMPPDCHNNGLTLDYEEEEDIPPLFQTQIDDAEIKRKTKKTNSATDANGELPTRQTPVNENENKKRSDSSTSGGEGSANKGKKKNFIKRNRELAAAANEVIAMTDDEKKRLQDLLGDIDDMPELNDGSLDDTLTESGVFQLALNPGDGFVPDDIQLKSLTNIDEKLRCIMPEDDFLSVVGDLSKHSTPREALFTRVGIKSTANLMDGFGEQVLFETKEERELKERLDNIEEKLHQFKGPQESETSATDAHLTDEQLNDLLNQCASSLSRTSVLDTPDSTARSELSSRQALLENPPKLSESQLQNLLSQAYFPMSSKLSAVHEHTGDNDDGDTITAETWKTIMEERLGSDSDDESAANQNQSQNALTENTSHWQESFYYDNLLAGKQEIVDNNYFTESDNEDSVLFRKNLNYSNKKTAGKELLTSFPKISSASSSKSASSFTSVSHNSASFSSASSLKDDAIQTMSPDHLRLPNISSNHFLIHTSQGLNNESPTNKEGSLSRAEPISLVHNDLSGHMSLTSLSGEEMDFCSNKKEQNIHRFFPKPPPGT